MTTLKSVARGNITILQRDRETGNNQLLLHNEGKERLDLKSIGKSPGPFQIELKLDGDNMRILIWTLDLFYELGG